MDKKKRLINCHIPTETCNFRCHYCYITLAEKFNNKIAKLLYSPKYIRNALSTERLGGKCLLNFTAGGETLLSDDIIPVAKELLEEGHYIELVTNGTISKRFDEIIMLNSELLQRLEFKFSFHYLELKRLNLINSFFNNIKKIRNAGCSFTIEITPNDELVEDINDIINLFEEYSLALPHLTIARDDRDINIPVLSKYSFDEYKNIWGIFNSDLFNFKTKIFYKKRNEFCYAGDWSLYINLITGDAQQCYCGNKLGNLYIDPEKPINFLPIGNNCTLAHCYNGHNLLTNGVIPELNTPTYAEMRNRRDKDGREWLNDKVNSFFNGKLKDSNKEYSFFRKYIINKKNRQRKQNRVKNILKRIIKRIIHERKNNI
jgi:organic radical activating enzyme